MCRTSAAVFSESLVARVRPGEDKAEETFLVLLTTKDPTPAPEIKETATTRTARQQIKCMRIRLGSVQPLQASEFVLINDSLYDSNPTEDNDPGC